MNSYQYESCHQTNKFIGTEMNITGWIRNIHHLSVQIYQTIKSGISRLFAWVWNKRPQEIIRVGPPPLYSAGGIITHPYTMRTGLIFTGIGPKIRNRKFWSGKIGQFNSMLNTILLWYETGVFSIAKVNGVRHIQLKCYPCLQIAGFISPNLGNRKDLNVYTSHYLCVKWCINIHTGQYGYCVQDPWGKNTKSRPNKISQS